MEAKADLEHFHYVALADEIEKSTCNFSVSPSRLGTRETSQSYLELHAE